MGEVPVKFDSHRFQSLKEAWRRERLENQPAKPWELWLCLKEAHEYPHDGLHLPTARLAFEQRAAIIEAYEKFRIASENLEGVLNGISKDWYLLGEPLFSNLSAQERAVLEGLEKYLPELRKLPNLPQRDRKPKPVKDAYTEAVALIVCHYCVVEEGRRSLRSEYQRETAMGREAIIFEATIKGLGHSPIGSLATRFRSASKRILSQENRPDWLEIVQELGLAIRSKN
jgi:hypothetical protein